VLPHQSEATSSSNSQMDRPFTVLQQHFRPVPGARQHAALLLNRKPPSYAPRGKTILQCSSRAQKVLFYMLWQFHREPLAWSCCLGPPTAFGTASGVRTPPAYTNLNIQKAFSHICLLYRKNYIRVRETKGLYPSY